MLHIAFRLACGGGTRKVPARRNLAVGGLEASVGAGRHNSLEVTGSLKAIGLGARCRLKVFVAQNLKDAFFGVDLGAVFAVVHELEACVLQGAQSGLASESVGRLTWCW